MHQGSHNEKYHVATFAERRLCWFKALRKRRLDVRFQKERREWQKREGKHLLTNGDGAASGA